MATSPIYNWPEPDNTDLVKNGALAIRTLGNAIDTTMATMVPKTIVDAKGDLIAATAADTPARLGVGADNTVLTADSTTATGLKWAAPASGMTNPMTTTGDIIYSSSGSTPARLGIGSSGQVLNVSGGVPAWTTPASGSMTLLASGTLSGTTVSLTSISQSYQNLYLVINNFRPVNANYPMYAQFNGDTAARYAGDQATVNVTNSTMTEIRMRITGSASGANQGIATITIPNYTNTTTWKVLYSDFIGNNTTTSTNLNYFRYFGALNQIGAVSSIQLFTEASGFTSGNYYLYGVK